MHLFLGDEERLNKMAEPSSLEKAQKCYREYSHLWCPYVAPGTRGYQQAVSMCPCKEPGDKREAVRDRQTKVSRQFVLGSRDCMTKFHIQLGL